MNRDTDYFKEQLTKYNTNFVFQIEFSHDVEKNQQASFDFSSFPFFYKTKESDLSDSQLKSAKALGRNIGREGEKLCSFLQTEGVTTEFSENLLYMCLIHDLQITKVLKIVKFKSYRFLKDYYQFLQIQRGKSDSRIAGKLLKSISNNLNGKLHANVTNVLHTNLCLNEKQFKKEIEKESFFDFRYLSENSCIIIKDKIQVTCKQPIQIPAQIYSNSKLTVFHGFLYLCHRWAKFGQYLSRATFTDTDSYCLAHFRPKTSLEICETDMLRAENKAIPFHETLIGKNYARTYTTVVAPILDFSSLNEDSLIYQTVESPLHRQMLKFLSSKRKNQSHFLSDELNCQLVKSVSSPSSKQVRKTKIRPDRPTDRLRTDRPTDATS